MSAIPWRLIGYVAGAAAVVLVLWWVQSRIRVSYQAEAERDAAVAEHAAYKTKAEQEAHRATLQQLRDQDGDAKLAGKLDAAQAELDVLRAARARQKPTVESTDAKGVTRTAIYGPWWLCVSTSVSRDAADRATCEAGSGDASLPYPVSR